jgi:hypothetical protein
MSESYLSKNAPLGAKKKYMKQCQYPDCEEIFMGIGASKYCDLHQKPEYKKKLIQMKDAILEAEYEEFSKSNTTIHHAHDKATEIELVCPCGQHFKTKLYPNVDTYPKYCEEHRNVYRRQLLEKKLNLGEVK